MVAGARRRPPVRRRRRLRSFRLDTSDPETAHWELTGTWGSDAEMHALLTVEHLLESIQPGPLGPQIAPPRGTIRRILGHGGHPAAEVVRRIRVMPEASRRPDPDRSRTIAAGPLSRRRPRLSHFRRNTGETLDRAVSPQRLVHYRDNWHLDAWCHLRDGLRVFAVAAVRVLDEPAREVAEAAMDRELAAGYGIFAGSRGGDGRRPLLAVSCAPGLP